jgi:hypothetical protein
MTVLRSVKVFHFLSSCCWTLAMLIAGFTHGFSLTTFLPLVMALYFARYYWCRLQNINAHMGYVTVESDATAKVRPVDWFFWFLMLVVGVGFARTFFKF